MQASAIKANRPINESRQLGSSTLSVVGVFTPRFLTVAASRIRAR